MGSMKSKAMICGGLLLIAAALCLVAYNLWDARRAADSVKGLIQDLEVQTGMVTSDPNMADFSYQSERETPAYILDPTMEMSTIALDGNEYIGTLEIPDLELSLPVMSEWSDPKLKLAPCRYTGSAYLNDLIVAAHNYPAHFGALSSLEQGAVVMFTDVMGNVFLYTVSEVEQLSSTALEEMERGDWDLTLFTCTVGGRARLTVRCVQTGDVPSASWH